MCTELLLTAVVGGDEAVGQAEAEGVGQLLPRRQGGAGAVCACFFWGGGVIGFRGLMISMIRSVIVGLSVNTPITHTHYPHHTQETHTTTQNITLSRTASARRAGS